MIVALAGGVGGAKLAYGLHALLGEDLVIVVNTGDDFRHLGLAISPDIDTITYTLAGLNDAERGWGLAGESWNFMAALERLGGATWFQIGDRDLATHVERTCRLDAGESLSAVTDEFRRRLGIRAVIVPMSDCRVSTVLETDSGILQFQDYFVGHRCAPIVRAIYFKGATGAQISQSFFNALNSDQLEAVILCPSNPFLSIDPILALDGVRARLGALSVPIIAVSPLVKGRAIKGPTAKLFSELGTTPSAFAVAQRYSDFLDGFVLDESDWALAADVEVLEIVPLSAKTVMNSSADKISLASTILDFAGELRQKRMCKRNRT